VNNIKVISVIATIILTGILGWISIEYFGDYGWTVFVTIPFLLGFLPPYIVGQKENLTKKDAYCLSFLTLGISLLGFLIFGIEGLICILMALPICGLLTWLGAFIGFSTISKKWVNQTSATIGLILVTLGTMSFDRVNRELNLIPIQTKIVVDAPIEEVWKNVVTFNKINEPTDWIFKTGIAYPTDATIEGEGVGAIRYCNFSTGSFVEPITVWNEPKLLKFDVKEQPIPMNELNPFWDIHPKHLDGYFKSYQGQFKLNELAEGKTELEGTTWYKVDIKPEFYWKLWSDFIIHRIHKRVLNHIKIETEKSKTPYNK